MSFGEFQDELRRVGRFVSGDSPAGLLPAAVEKVRNNPTFAQSRLLTRLLHALAEQSGEFRRAEASAFDSETLKLVIGLLDTACAGTTSRAAWQRAAADSEMP